MGKNLGFPIPWTQKVFYGKKSDWMYKEKLANLSYAVAKGALAAWNSHIETSKKSSFFFTI